ncbi:MAG TPA: L,D-transpeptidase [Flavobacterium sp.]|jgi:lipoprotein-anchoring transpeptidase ErfK/SrfK
MKKSVLFLSIIISIIASSCKDNKEVETKKAPERKKPAMSYHMENAKQWLDANAADSTKVRIALALNRTDKAFFTKMDSVVIADDMNGDLSYYLPFPLEVPYLKDINKIIFFSYPTQTFATYEKGSLTYTGPTNMGRKKDPTPTGLFYTNWKAEETISTFDDEWKLRWNFNIENKLGVGWHQYELPGYPASHSCLRLQEKDARYLYDWADQWVLADKDSVQIKGTPVIVFGSYDFGGPKPWLQLITDPRALDISSAEIQKQTQPFLNAILSEQKNRAKHQAAKPE